jgi:hypothetical protein
METFDRLKLLNKEESKGRYEEKHSSLSNLNGLFLTNVHYKKDDLDIEKILDKMGEK